MRLGSGPMARRLAAYRAGHRPWTAKAAAMPDRVSPARTTYRVAGRGAGAAAGIAVAASGAVAMTVMVTRVVLLLALRGCAWARRAGIIMAAVASMSRMHQ